MTHIRSFPKILAIGSKFVLDIFESEVEITEKIDGSQFSFSKTDNELSIRSKGKEMYLEQYDKMFNKCVEYVKSIKDKLPEGIVFYCEYLNKPKHNCLKYEKTPKNYLALFGATKDDVFIDNYEQLVEYSKVLDIDVVPLLFKGKINSIEDIKNLLDKDSYLGGCKIEGFVVKNYNKSLLLGGMAIPIMCGKYVSEAFKEVHRSDWKKENTSKGKLQDFFDSFKTEARWLKAIQRLKENSLLEDSPSDIGKILKEVNIDIEAEEKENIKDWLYENFKKDILRNATKGLPQWYKDKLVKDTLKA